MTSDFQVLVIGGGPGGTTVASLLADRGHRIALFEKQTFPRFHVGESLVPAINNTLEELGVLDRMDSKHFPRKQGVQFFSHNGPTRPFYFAEVGDPKLNQTWQVLRGEFDDLLLERARELGVQVFDRCEVREVCTDGTGVTGLRIDGADNEQRTIRGQVVIDASGQRSMLARRFGDREHIPDLHNASVFAHYNGVRRDEGKDAGSTLIYRLNARSWLWLIPLPDVVSIGLVAPTTDFANMNSNAKEILQDAIASSPHLMERMSEARLASEVFTVRDHSYRARIDGGPGWALVGDALGFIDPIYSTGLLLTMLSAKLAAAKISEALSAGQESPDLHGFSAEYQDAYQQYLWLVRAFYQDDFHFGKLAKDPSQHRGLVEMLSGVIGTPNGLAVIDAIKRFFAED